MTEHVFSLEGRTAVITGGTTGLGLAIAECMVKAGARVAVLSRRTKEEGQSALKEMGEKAVFYHHDITDTGHAPELADQIIREMGPVTILVNNAGNHCKKFIEDMTVDGLQTRAGCPFGRGLRPDKSILRPYEGAGKREHYFPGQYDQLHWPAPGGGIFHGKGRLSGAGAHVGR